MCLARSTPHTGSSGAQGLWSEFTAKPQLAAPKGSTGPREGSHSKTTVFRERNAESRAPKPEDAEFCSVDFACINFAFA